MNAARRSGVSRPVRACIGAGASRTLDMSAVQASASAAANTTMIARDGERTCDHRIKTADPACAKQNNPDRPAPGRHHRDVLAYYNPRQKQPSS